MDLHFQSFPNNQSTSPALIILHGLFGSSNNWRALGKRFATRQAVYALDLRNHGESPHADSMSLSEMASDVVQFMHTQSLSSCHLLGHSMGGKVAMQLALDYPRLLSSLIVADIAPKVYPPRHDDIFSAIAAINAATLSSRNEADRLIQPIVPEQATRLFLLTNLVRNPTGHYVWRINTDSIHKNYLHISAAPQTSGQLPSMQSTLFVKGEQSRYIQTDDMQTIRQLFPKADLESIADAGHWVHAEQPETFASIVEAFLDTLP